MVTLAFMRHFTSQRGIHNAVVCAVPLALSLGIGSLGAIALTATSAIAQGSSMVLNAGDQGETVVRLQQRLAELGFFSGEATGFYGPLTEEAVIGYQNSQGLIADGVAGPETLGALLPRVASQGSPFQPERPLNSQPFDSQQLDSRQLQNVQAQLSRLGFYLGEVDGVYGPQTEAAINSFQSIYALPVTGVTDPLTVTTLERVYSQTGDGSSNASSPVSRSIGFGSSNSNFPSTVSRPQVSTTVSTTSVDLPPAIPSGPTLAANIPQTTTLSSPLPPPSLPNNSSGFGNGNFNDGNFNNGNFGNGDFNNDNFSSQSFNTLPPLGNGNPPIRQTPQFAAAPGSIGFPYVVAIPVKTGATLSEVRRAASNAFLAGSKRGTYIQAGAYNSREDAERATQRLRDRRLDARVIYRPE